MPGKYDKRLGMYRDKDGQSVFLGTNNVVDLYISNETEWLQAWEIFMNGEDAVRGWVNGNLILTDNREFFVDYATAQTKFFELRGIGTRPIRCGNFDLTIGRIYFENMSLSRTNEAPMLKVREGTFTADNLHFRYLNGIGRISTPVPNIEIIGNYVSRTGSIKLKNISHASGDSSDANLSGDVQPFIILNNAGGAGLDGSNVYISIAEVQSISNFDVFSRVLLQSNQAVRYMVTGDETWYHDPAQLWPGAGNINATAEVLKHSSIDNARVDNMPTDTTLEFITGISATKRLRQISKADFLADVNLKLLDSNAYGVRFDTTAAATACTRIGNLTNHVLLPIQNKMKRCLLDDAGNVLTYLKNDNSLLKPDGTAATLDGTSGQVMVEIPEFYYKSWTDGNFFNILISEYALTGYTKSAKQYIGAFKAGLQRSNSKLGSFINLNADFRGGNNNAAWDAAANTLLGKPATNINLTNFRTYARNRGARWQAMPFVTKTAFNILYLVEYANRNSQAAFNAALTAEGYKQGGLGDGVTNVNGTNWNTFSGYYPIIPTGKTVSIGNASGTVNYTIAGFTGGDITVPVNSYRGIENPFGDIWEWCDGVLFNIQAADSGGQSLVYVCDVPANYADAITANYRQAGLLARVSGYMTKMIGGTECILLPAEATGGSSTTFWPDYLDQSIPANGTSVRGLLVSATAHYGAYAGLWSASAFHTPAHASAYLGSRVCFL